MKIRLRHKLYLSCIALWAWWTLQHYLPSHNAIISTISALGYITLSLLIIVCSARLMWVYMLFENWAIECLARDGSKYPLRKLRVLDGEEEVTKLIAGYEGEVNGEGVERYGYTQHIDYVVHIEDLCNLSDEQLIEHINDVYDREYEEVEK